MVELASGDGSRGCRGCGHGLGPALVAGREAHTTLLDSTVCWHSGA